MWNEEEFTCDIRSTPISSTTDLISRFQNACRLISENVDITTENSKSKKKKKRKMITLVTSSSCDLLKKKLLMEEAEKQ